jgi:hypothetical protein
MPRKPSSRSRPDVTLEIRSGPIFRLTLQKNLATLTLVITILAGVLQLGSLLMSLGIISKLADWLQILISKGG